MSGKFQLVASNGPVNIWLDNHPQGQTQPPDDELIPAVIDYAITDPGAFSMGLFRKAAYVFGFHTLNRNEIKFFVFIPTLLALYSVYGLIRGRRKNIRREMVLLLLWIGMIDAVLILTRPWIYGWRLVAPTFLPLYVLSAMAIEDIIEAFSNRRNKKTVASGNALTTADRPGPRSRGIRIEKKISVPSQTVDRLLES